MYSKYTKPYIPKSSNTLLTKRGLKEKEFEYIVAIGTSTGGPRALQSVLPLLPKILMEP